MTRKTDVESRLARLERDNRRLRRVVYAGAIAVTGAVVMAQSRPAQTLEAERFVVRDAAGNVRAVFGMDEDAPRLALYAPGDEIESVWLGLMDDVPLFTLQQVGGAFQSQLTKGIFFIRGSTGSMLLDLEAPDAAGGLALRDANGGTRARINWPGSETALSLYNPEGAARIVAGVDSRGIASLTLPGPDGRRGAELYSRDESLGLLINDPLGRLRFAVDVPASGTANLGIFDTEGRTLFGVP